MCNDAGGCHGIVSALLLICITQHMHTRTRVVARTHTQANQTVSKEAVSHFVDNVHLCQNEGQVLCNNLYISVGLLEFKESHRKKRVCD